MSVGGPTTVGLFSLFGAVPAGILIYLLLDEREKPAIQWFVLAMAAGGGWSITWGLSLLVSSATLTMLFQNIFNFFATLAAIAWFLLAVEFSYRKTVWRGYFGLLLVIPLTTQVLIWSGNPRHLVYASDSYVDEAGIFVREIGPWLAFDHQIFAYSLVFGAVAIWIGKAMTSTGKRRQQLVWWIIATGILILPGISWNLGLVPIYLELTPYAIFFAGFGFIYLFFEDRKLRLFNITPFAREQALDELDNAVVTLNADGRIADINPAMQRLFALDQTDVRGATIEAVWADYPELIESIAEGVSNREVSLSIDGSERHFVLRVSPVEYGRGAVGKTVVLDDVTALIERERELHLLKRVFARIFRHNIRNELMVVESYANMISEAGDQTHAEYSQEILESAGRILDHSEKARLIEAVVDESVLECITIEDLVADVITPYHRDQAEITVEFEDNWTIQAHPQIRAALEELLDNAIQHGHRDDGTTTHVEIWAERDGNYVTLYVEDDAGGLDEHEIDVLERAVESDLEHGSGVGLWLVRWVLQSSHGELVVELTDEGTRMGLVLPTPDS